MKKALILVLVFVLTLSVFATSFAAFDLGVINKDNSKGKVIVNVGNNNGGGTTLSSPPRIIEW